MIFDEANAVITEKLTGRTIQHVVRNGKVLEIYTDDGHIIQLQADVDGDIHYKGMSVKITLEGLDVFGEIGKF